MEYPLTKEFKIFNHENKYLLIVDDSPVGFKKGEYMYDEPNNSEKLYCFSYDITPYEIGNKVLAHLPINGSEVLPKLLLLPELGSDGIDIRQRYKDSKNLCNATINMIETLVEHERNKPASYSASEMVEAMNDMYRWCGSHEYDYEKKKEVLIQIIDKVTRAKYPKSIIVDMRKMKLITYKNGSGKLVVSGDYKN